jgi:hypothetical protein
MAVRLQNVQAGLTHRMIYTYYRYVGGFLVFPVGIHAFLYIVRSHMAMRLLALSPNEDSWYSFLLEAESTPGP